MTFNTWEPKLFVMRIIMQYTELLMYSYLFAMLISLCMTAWCMFIDTSDTVLCCILQNGFIGKGTMPLVQSKWESVIDSIKSMVRGLLTFLKQVGLFTKFLRLNE